MFTPEPEREPGDYSNRGWDYGRLCLTLRTVAIVVAFIALLTWMAWDGPASNKGYEEDIPFRPNSGE